MRRDLGNTKDITGQYGDESVGGDIQSQKTPP